MTSDASILINAANLLVDTSDEYSHLDSSKVHAFMDEIQHVHSIDDVVLSPTKSIRKRRLSIEYPFPFLVEQAKKQRMTPKKLRTSLLLNDLNETLSVELRPPSPEYHFSSLDSSLSMAVPSNELFASNLNDTIDSTKISSTSKRSSSIVDFRHLQANMQKIMLQTFEHDHHLCFSELFSSLYLNEHRSLTTQSSPLLSSDIGICFAALLNNAVRHQLALETNDVRDDIRIHSSESTHEQKY
jgi:hypothetical protein